MSTSRIDKCTTSSILPRQVSIVFSCIYGLILLFVMYYSFVQLMNHDHKFRDLKTLPKLKLWVHDVWKRRLCFLPIVTHLLDQISDIAVAIEFGILAQNTTKEDCGGLNMWYLFGLTILSMATYRTISAYLIFLVSKSPMRILSQLLDLELFRALYIGFKLNKSEPCDPQRWITGMEATFESTPQALVQIIYLSKTNNWNHSPIVLISFIWSVFSIILKGVSSDKRIVQKGKSLESEPCWFLLRFIWRFCDISLRIFTFTLVWLSMGGTALTAIIITEMTLLSIFCVWRKDWSLLFTVVSIPNDKILFLYRISYNFILLTLITCFVTIEFSCDRCPDFDERRTFIFKNKVIYFIFIYSWIASMFVCLKLIIPFKQRASSSRNIVHMASAKDWNGLKEMHAFSGIDGDWSQVLINRIPQTLSVPEGSEMVFAVCRIETTRREYKHWRGSAKYWGRDWLKPDERKQFDKKIDTKSATVLEKAFAELFEVLPTNIRIIWLPSDEAGIYLRLVMVHFVYSEQIQQLEQKKNLVGKNLITPKLYLDHYFKILHSDILKTLTEFWDLGDEQAASPETIQIVWELDDIIGAMSKGTNLKEIVMINTAPIPQKKLENEVEVKALNSEYDAIVNKTEDDDDMENGMQALNDIMSYKKETNNEESEESLFRK
eukprot:270193_1